MTYEAFVALVERLWAEIPEAFKRELQGVHVLPQAKPEPGLKGVWRLGEYLDPGPPSTFRGFEGLGRHIALYYGSFQKVAGPGFDWEEEVWETLLHELRHHLESLAGRDDLVQEDLRRLAAFRRGAPPGEGEG
ncbi:metallopeptidase family protein [Thermus scotoductus]|uniref:metallopeptidase family protein n=1 Tax=Thermus scotoductus TaxID=37636 RepID=UPI00035F2AD5|nr:metallopeptidase family protein [Thermus scotoductus]